ncbi:hypothetical protein ABFS82_12G060900 [Erythranthe guttata]
MSCLFWKCQGLGGPLTIHEIGAMLQKFHPSLVFISETKSTPRFVNILKGRWNYDGICVNREGLFGGLALLWKKDMNVTLLSFSKNHIDMVVENSEKEVKWRCTGFYGFLETQWRRDSWTLLRQLRDLSPLPWLVGGDYNEIMCNSEKEGGLPRLPYQIEEFRRCLIDCDLSDLGFEGPGAGVYVVQ